MLLKSCCSVNLSSLIESKTKSRFSSQLKKIITLYLIIMTVPLVECQSKQLAISRTIGSSQERPEFAKSIPNLSIVTGKDAVMRCSVKNLGNNIISWHHLESNTDLTINKQVLSPNPRIKIKQDGDDWLLIINNVSLEDRGFYICRINWLEPKSQLGYLNVVEPPQFDENSFPNEGETIVRENDNLTLSCRASGNPSPTIEWRREDGRPIYIANLKSVYPETGVPKIIGEEMTFRPVTRWNMGSYLCIASNGIPPSISRRIMLIVQFSPIIRIPSSSITIEKGSNVTLQCPSESSPIADHMWLNQNGGLIGTSKRRGGRRKYTVTSVKTYHFKVTYQLTITDVDLTDAGRYVCMVNNTLGLARSTILLQVKENPSPTTEAILTTEEEPASELDSEGTNDLEMIYQTSLPGTSPLPETQYNSIPEDSRLNQGEKDAMKDSTYQKFQSSNSAVAIVLTFLLLNQF